ncbi:MAG TPA: hypothetical protein VJ720_10780, partial [Chitinophaga sp.]|nr:hypothetical protein [Chitinophaga sp.]
MKKATLSLVMMLFFVNSYSQLISRRTEYIYGKMINTTDTLVGYFSFDREITQNGQTVYYKQSLDSNKKKRFQSRKYDYFQSDSLYLEKFGAVSILTGDVLIMIPRIINGRIQLFDSKVK